VKCGIGSELEWNNCCCSSELNFIDGGRMNGAVVSLKGKMSVVGNECKGKNGCLSKKSQWPKLLLVK